MSVRGIAVLLSVAGFVGCAPYAPPQLVPQTPYAAYRPAPYPGGYSPYPPSYYYEAPSYNSRTAVSAPKVAAKPRPVAPVVATPVRTEAAAAEGGLEKAVPAAATVPAGPECRTVTQLGYADGKEVQRQERYCRASPGREWVRS